MFKPTQDRVLVKVIEKKKEEASAIIIPDTCQVKQETCRFAEVVLAGVRTGDHLPDSDLRPGQHIVILSYGGTEVVIDGVKHLVIKYEEILLRED